MISCDPQDLVTASSCLLCQQPNLNNIDIYLLCIIAGGTPPVSGIVFGNPDTDIQFGDPTTGDNFGVP